MIWTTPHTYFGSLLFRLPVETVAIPFPVFLVHHMVFDKSPDRIGRLQPSFVSAYLPGIDASYHGFNLSPPRSMPGFSVTFLLVNHIAFITHSFGQTSSRYIQCKLVCLFYQVLIFQRTGSLAKQPSRSQHHVRKNPFRPDCSTHYQRTD